MAGAAILTGMMIGAVVEILVAEETAPAFVANAIPGFGACAMNAAGIEFAFVAERTLPTGLATGKREKKE